MSVNPSAFTGSLSATLQPSGDPTGTADTSTLQNAATNAPPGTQLLLAPGQWQTKNPIVYPPTQAIEFVGPVGCTQGGGGSPGVAAVINPVAGFSQGTAPNLAVFCMGAATRQGLRKLWINGNAAAAVAGLQGVNASGSGTSSELERVGINNMPGWGAHLNAGFGLLTDTMIIQTCGANPGAIDLDGGVAGAYYGGSTDAHHWNIHAQNNTGHGIDIHGNDHYLVACRADGNTVHAYHLSPFLSTSILGIGVRLIGCTTEGGSGANAGQEACYIIGGGHATYGPVWLIGCNFTGDGQATPLTYAAVNCVGRVAVYGDFSVASGWLAYALQTTQNTGSHAVPDLVDIAGGMWHVGGPTFLNDSGPATKLTLGPAVQGVIAPLMTVAAGSNGGILQNIATWSSPSAGVLAVASVPAWVPSSGTIYVVCSNGDQGQITYAGTTATTFTGCAYVSGAPSPDAVATGGQVTQYSGSTGTTPFAPGAQNGGTATFSGTGSATVFNIAHGLQQAPSTWSVDAASTAANGTFYVTASATQLTVTFAVAPASGTNNVVLAWTARL